jgi:hypothetical protein
MTDETTKGFSTSIYVTDRQAFEECKRLLKLQGRSLSEEIMDFVLRRLDELRGVKHDTSVEEADRYSELKDRHSRLVCQLDKMQKRLKAQSVPYDEADELLAAVGARSDLSNCDEVIPKFMLAWKGSQEFMHEYITLVEVAREKKEVETRLRELRSRS